jgi:hypothetical protein
MQAQPLDYSYAYPYATYSVYRDPIYVRAAPVYHRRSSQWHPQSSGKSATPAAVTTCKATG